ncbi:MAG: alpha/beta hydrolase [Gemmatimonadetes bacterium]|uniref:Alpha/beta hydrolase n=1 Tax=Candidatus Kutchimonas denitrificans TaxID=3056748 RepID=A0AAE4ZCX3_9BACT|nr:alpha/beta hydrolase [Gemmatimonadota bacterium]NIR76331.1 alpha/beta hydrolase [Candidatus Kutchimonas denitrificans]NIS02354.1 alpha/beta hydrolase [Gemmatimonadota bacterium]NIT68173.1 alpha/beta hydrolase [Gemmatimonadota bacterium]NIU54397.1 alpha/beta fold hydrolase [Gemmatimonadota bacterium]
MVGCQEETLQPPPSGELAECVITGIGSALCGSFPVYEDRVAMSGRTLGIAVVVLPATGADRRPDPVVFLMGGPGESATGLAAAYGSFYAGLRDERDLVFIDQRGTGLSNRLACPGPLPGGPGSVLGSLFPPDHIEACRQRLAGEANLRLYATHLAVDDLAEVLTRLGYDRVNLNGGSFGTRTVQVFLRRHPSKVRTAVMNAVAPIDRNIYLRGAANVDTALDVLFADCEADATCANNYPGIRIKFWDLVSEFDQGPIELQLSVGTVRFDRGDFGYAVRGMLYGDLADNILAWTWEAFLTGDLSRFAEYAVQRSSWVASATFATGMHLSVICTEDIPFTTDAEIDALTAGTLLGSTLIDRYRAACDRWVEGALPSDFHAPVVSDVPALLISGQRDPATPPAWGDEVASRLTNARHIVVPMGGHGVAGPCTYEAERLLVTQASTEGIQTTCPPGG